MKKAYLLLALLAAMTAAACGNVQIAEVDHSCHGSCGADFH